MERKNQNEVMYNSYIYIYLTGWLASHYILASYEQWSDGDLLPPKRFPAADALVRFPERP